jgi:protocatechuate 3,4-dioxygenase, beta subunit
VTGSKILEENSVQLVPTTTGEKESMNRLNCPFLKTQPGTQPDYLHPPYASSVLRAPQRPLIVVPQTLSELSGPVFANSQFSEFDNDLTRQHTGEPLGERIIVSGRVLDENDRPVRGALVEVWQANAAGRYRHKIDQHDAPLDPNFSGAGRFLTDDSGFYRFITIKPGAYPWKNHANAWRPAHIHFSLFGDGLLTRLVTQMYFPGDPLLPYDPIYNCVSDEKAKRRMISSFDLATTIPSTALGYHYDIILRGRDATLMETHP